MPTLLQRPRLWLLCALILSVAPIARADADADALRLAVATERQRASAPRFERDAFLTRPSVGPVALSSDGRRLAYIQDDGRERSVWLQDTSGGAPRRLLTRSVAHRLSWTRDSRWLLLESPRQIFALASTDQAGSGIVTTLGGPEQRELLGIDPGHAAAVIVREQAPPAPGVKGAHWRLLRIELGGRRTLLHESAQRIADYAFDEQGRLAFLGRVEAQHIAILRFDQDAGAHEIARCERMQRCDFLGTLNRGRELLLRGDLGQDLGGLLRLAADGRVHVFHVDPRGEADIDAVVLNPLTRQPSIASYRSTVPSNYGLDDASRRALAAIESQLPQRDLRIAIGHGADARWLVNERGSTLQGERWHLFDPRRVSLTRVLQQPLLGQRSGTPVAALPEAAMARKIPFAYRASDGMRLHGFLLLPPGKNPAELPLIVDVHGGPWNQVRDDFSAVAQFLVNRGYAVFEPNFRGSTGHGRDYLFAAQGDFGHGRVQQDIVEGARHLLAQGIGDADRVGITGASFGGYSSLLGVTFDSELFKVAIAVVPPPDFSWNLRWLARSPEALNLAGVVPFVDSMRMLDLDIDDAAMHARLHAQSPLANAAKMNRPLLIIASGEDRRVPLRGVLEYAAQLKLLGKDVSLLVDPDAGHQQTDPLARAAILFLTEEMLQRHLGAAAATPPAADLRAYMERHLRIVGTGLRGVATKE